MTTHGIGRLALAGAVALTLGVVSFEPVHGQGAPGGFPNVVGALKAAPGVLGVETGQTASGRRVIFAWFDGKQSLVDWYHSDIHQRAMRTVYPNGAFDRQPLPDLPDNTGPILTIVSVKFADAPEPGASAPRIVAIGIELYGPLPGGVAVGGRFAPEAVKVPGLRDIDLTRARQAEPR
jgi:heme-degrading monooxygenase HmoA